MNALETITMVVGAIRQLAAIPGEVTGNKAECSRLAQRCCNLLPSLGALRDRVQASNNPAELRRLQATLSAMLDLLNEASGFMHRFKDTSYFFKAWKRNSDREGFQVLNMQISQLVGDLQLEVQIDAELQRREDIQDAQEDIRHMFEMVRDQLGNTSDAIIQELHAVHNHQIQRLEATSDQVTAAMAEQDSVHNQRHLELVALIESIQTSFHPPVPVKPYYDGQLYVDRNKVLGSGAFGTVLQGSYQGCQVAVKLVRTLGLGADDVKMIEREILVHQSLDSPRIIRLFGARITPDECTLVLEFALGSLHDWLYRNQPPLQRSFPMKLYFLLDLASALQYLHACNIIHRDVKPENCLIASDFSLKLSDFGLARVKTTHTMGTMKAMGTPAYMAPEILNHPPHYTSACDVYAFAVLANEVIGEKRPFDGQTPQGIAVAVMHQDKRPQEFRHEDAIGEELKLLVRQSWSSEKVARPSVTAICTTMQRLAPAAGLDPRHPLRVRTEPLSVSAARVAAHHDHEVIKLLEAALETALAGEDFDQAEYVDGLLQSATAVAESLGSVKSEMEIAKATRDFVALRRLKTARDDLEAKLMSFTSSSSSSSGSVFQSSSMTPSEGTSSSLHSAVQAETAKSTGLDGVGPNCDTVVSPAPSSATETVLLQQPGAYVDESSSRIYCSLCRSPLREPSDLEDHRLICQAAIVDCLMASSGCQHRGPRIEMHNHLGGESCAWYTPCPVCKVQLHRAAYVEHVLQHVHNKHEQPSTACIFGSEGCSFTARDFNQELQWKHSQRCKYAVAVCVECKAAIPAFASNATGAICATCQQKHRANPRAVQIALVGLHAA